MAGAIKLRSQVLLRDGHPHARGKALTERPGRRFNSLDKEILRMSGRPASELPELLQVFERQVVAGQMQQAVEQH